MNLLLLTYIVELLDPFKHILNITAMLCFICMFFVAFWFFVEKGSYYSSELDNNDKPKQEVLDKENIITNIGVISFKVCMTCLILTTLIPSEKTAYMMVGAYVTETVITSPVTAKIVDKTIDKVGKVADNTDEISGKVLTILNQKLDKYIKEGEDVVVKK